MSVRQEVLRLSSLIGFVPSSIFRPLRHHSFGISRFHLFRNHSPHPATYSVLVPHSADITYFFNHSSFELNQHEPHILRHRFYFTLKNYSLFVPFIQCNVKIIIYSQNFTNSPLLSIRVRQFHPILK